MWVVFTALLMGLCIGIEEPVPYAVGERLDRAIYARVELRVEDVKQTALAQENAQVNTPSYYRYNPTPYAERVRNDLMRLFQTAKDSDTHGKYARALEPYYWPADEATYQVLRSMASSGGDATYEQWVSGLPLFDEYIVSDLVEKRNPPSRATFLRVVQASGTTDVSLRNRNLINQQSTEELRDRAQQLARVFQPASIRQTIATIIQEAMSAQPTIAYDSERTLSEVDKAVAAVPRVYLTYVPGQPFISPHVAGGATLSEAQYSLLRAEHEAYLRFLDGDSPEAHRLRRERLLQRCGLAGTELLLSIGLFSYVRYNRPRMYILRSRTIALVILVIGTLAFARFLDWRWPSLPELMLTPCLIAGGVLAIAYPPRLALGMMLFVSVMLTVLVRENLAYLLTLASGLAVAVYSLEDIRTRTKIITSGVLTAIAVAAASGFGGLLAGQTVDFSSRHAVWAAICVLASAFIFTGILPFVERIFRIATSLTLLEWRDPTRPLLQLLAREAPGTYNHSLVLGNLGEAACEAIGANGLLAQVGALYHDIGKIYKPDYFTENQEGRASRHDNLAPSMSLLIILAHVKDGLELAREYRLPQVLHQFIEEHHGTTIVKYFHHRASEIQPQIASGRHDREVSDSEFRYGGPKPRTKESAVLMMCDGVEGAVRSLSEPTAGRIESTVHNIIMDRLGDGQFDDCPITLREIRLAEESIVKSLCSIYHGRVAYPKAQKADEGQRAPRGGARAAG